MWANLLEWPFRTCTHIFVTTELVLLGLMLALLIEHEVMDSRRPRSYALLWALLTVVVGGPLRLIGAGYRLLFSSWSLYVISEMGAAAAAAGPILLFARDNVERWLDPSKAEVSPVTQYELLYVFLGGLAFMYLLRGVAVHKQKVELRQANRERNPAA